MNKKVLTGVGAVVAVLLIGGGAYMMMRGNKSSDISPQTTQQESKSTKQALKDLISSGVSQKCVYKDTQEGVDIEGTTYVGNGKVRADFSSTFEGNTTVGHSIYDGSVSYIWNDGMETGYKMMVDMSEGESMEEEPQSQSMDLAKPIDYDCSPWVVDQSVFVPPSDVTFTELNTPTVSIDSMEESMEMGDNSAACSYCESLSGDAKTQCLTSLNCE